MSAFTFGSPTHWRYRAEEARAMAGGMEDSDARRAMLGIASSYEMIAERVENPGGPASRIVREGQLAPRHSTQRLPPPPPPPR
jgi:hypothetical protein